MKPHRDLSPSPTRRSDPAACVRAELAAMEQKLLLMLDSRESLIAEICHYLIDGVGKRVRPLFVLLSYRACGGLDERLDDAIDAAIAIELIHSATLLHDDIIDGGTMRRGKPSVLARYGAAASLVAGDFLFCRAFELCGRFEERLVRIAAHACISLTEGEVMEGRMRHNAAARIEDYLEIITRKTASLFAAGARVAADLAGAAPATVGALEAVGLALGRSFQMMDDVLDVSGSEERIGKPIGSDLRTGVLSLPLVLGMHELPELRNFFANGGHGGAAAIESALRMVRHPSILERARAMAAEQAALARHHLGELAPSIYRDSLGLLLDEQRDRAT